MTRDADHAVIGDSPFALGGNRRWIRLALAALGCLVSLGGAAGVLWWQDWRYSLPTPRPEGLVQVAAGSRIQVASLDAMLPAPNGRPVLLTFLNPNCPCSRFNLDHVRALQQEWEGRVDFAAVVEGPARSRAARELARLGLQMDAIPDPDGRIAAAYGVYSSPQAVVLDAQRRLYFRGNFNASRYCTVAATEYARLALDSLSMGQPTPRFPGTDIAYGCELPSREGHHD